MLTDVKKEEKNLKLEGYDELIGILLETFDTCFMP